jgi:hypothetical protein
MGCLGNEKGASNGIMSNGFVTHVSVTGLMMVELTLIVRSCTTLLIRFSLHPGLDYFFLMNTTQEFCNVTVLCRINLIKKFPSEMHWIQFQM